MSAECGVSSGNIVGSKMLGKPQPLISMNCLCCEESSSRSGAGNIAILVGQDMRVRRLEGPTPQKET